MRRWALLFDICDSGYVSQTQSPYVAVVVAFRTTASCTDGCIACPLGCWLAVVLRGRALGLVPCAVSIMQVVLFCGVASVPSHMNIEETVVGAGSFLLNATVLPFVQLA